MPKVTLINFTGLGHGDPLYAARILAFTKATRLNMTPDTMTKFMTMPQDAVLKEMDYMAGTIPSSWEFVDLTFLIEKVSRATAQQITRTRTASFAMQSQRVTDMSNVTFDNRDNAFNSRMQKAVFNYSAEVQKGTPLEDARDLLPIGVHCNLVAKYNLRALVDLVRARESLRVQGPYVDVISQMKTQTLAIWPWAEKFFEPKDKKAIDMIEDVARDLAAMEGEKGAMYKGLTGRLAKAADLLKK